MTETRNRNQWLSVASFLALQNLRTVLQQKARRAEGAPLAGEEPARRAAINFGGRGAACTTSVPVGNTGTTFERGEA